MLHTLGVSLFVHNGVIAALAKLAPAAPAELSVLSDRPDATVVRAGDVVLKVHAPETVERELEAQLRAAAGLGGVLLAPLSLGVVRVGGRLVTRWPYAEPLRHDLPHIPWAEAGSMLARLHRVVVAAAARLPPAGAPRRVLRAVERLQQAAPSSARTAVLDAFATLPAGSLEPPPHGHMTHGDFHLGQLVQAEDGWRLVDIDQLGRGDPRWDLARPAAWYALGLMPPEAWTSFISSYRGAAGPALPGGDPWPALEVPARACVVQSAARIVEKAQREDRPFDEAEQVLIAACRRIARGELQ
jgi:hypothetical protein